MKSVKCAKCGFVGWSDAETCKKCGESVSAPNVYATQSPAGNFSAPSAATAYPVAPYQVSPYSNYNMMPSGELKNGLAIAALVLGLLNFLFTSIFVVPVIVGIVISVKALNKIKNYPSEYGGKSMAIAGLATNIVSAVFLIPVLLVLAIAIPNLMASVRAANEGSAMQTLTNISSAEATYQSTVGNGNYGTLTDLRRQSLISAEVASGIKSGYQYKIDVQSGANGSPAGFTAVAVPTQYGSTGERSFFIDETGVLRGEDSHGLDANRSAPPVDSYRRYLERPESRRSASYSD